MERLLTCIAAAVALAITLLLPGIGLYAGGHSQHSILQAEAEINARLVSQLINENPELWRVTVPRLEELLRKRPGDGTPETRSLFDLQGVLIAESADALAPPLIEHAMPVHDAGRPVGTLRIRRSMRPLLVQAAWLGLVGLLLGTAAFVTLRTLPLRALRLSNDRLRHEATHDALTGLPNRVLLRDRLEQAMERAQRSRRALALMFVDLDRFKDINDGLGHGIGDEVLQLATRRIERCLAQGWSDGRRASDGLFTVARVGGDEFTVLLESAGSVDDTTALTERLQAMLAEPMHLGGHVVHLQCSIGIAFFPQDGADANLLLRHADMAMYRAKEKGRNGYQYFSQELTRETQDRIALVHALHGALERGEFELHFQPKADLRSGAVTGVEALLRWHSREHGLVGPDRFIALLEASRLILPVGAWVIETACAQLVAWDRAGLPPLTMAVNVSPRQFRDPELPAHVARVLQASGLAPHRLQLEMTESLLMEDNKLSLEILGRIGSLGVTLAIDDFGTGYSSLAYLKRFQVDTLKLDRSFVRGLPDDRENAAIAAAVLALARSLEMQVVCEGVETAAQREFLRELGCDLMQGWHLGRPMPAVAFVAWLHARNGVTTAPAAPRLHAVQG